MILVSSESLFLTVINEQSSETSAVPIDHRGSHGL